MLCFIHRPYFEVGTGYTFCVFKYVRKVGLSSTDTLYAEELRIFYSSPDIERVLK